MARGGAMRTRHREHPNLMECTAPSKLVRCPRYERCAPSESLRNVGDSYTETPASESAGTRVTGIGRGPQHLYASSCKRCSLRRQENCPVRWPAYVGGRVLPRAARGRTDAGASRAVAFDCLLDKPRVSGGGCRENQISIPISNCGTCQGSGKRCKRLNRAAFGATTVARRERRSHLRSKAAGSGIHERWQYRSFSG